MFYSFLKNFQRVRQPNRFFKGLQDLKESSKKNIVSGYKVKSWSKLLSITSNKVEIFEVACVQEIVKVREWIIMIPHMGLLTNVIPVKVTQNSFQHFPRRRFWWVIITTLYQLMLQSWYQKTAQSLANTLVSFSWHYRLP